MSFLTTITLSGLLLAYSGEPSRDHNFLFWLELSKSPSLDLQINALHRLGDVQRPEAVPAIEALLTSSQAELRYHAARTLAKIPHESSLQALSGRVNAEQDVYVRSEINRSIRILREVQTRSEGRSVPKDEE